MRIVALVLAAVVTASCRSVPIREDTLGGPIYESPDAVFSVRFPFGPVQIRHLLNGTVKRTDYWVADRANTFRVQVFEDATYSLQRAEELLRDYPSPASGGVNGWVVSASRIQWGRYPGRAVRIEGTVDAAPGRVVSVHRVFVTETRMLLVTVSAGPGQTLSPVADPFLDSFMILR